MNDSWPHASKEFDEDTLDALRIITEAATQHRIPFLLVGAMARDMLLQHVHDMSRERRMWISLPLEIRRPLKNGEMQGSENSQGAQCIGHT